MLRHDVDRSPEMELRMAEMEMGHEIGYQYEVLDKAVQNLTFL